MQPGKNNNLKTEEKKISTFSFIHFRNYSYLISLAMIIGFIIPLLMGQNINWGIDFAGGIKIQVKLPKKKGDIQLRKAIKELNLSASIQTVGTKDKNEFIISMGLLNSQIQKRLVEKYSDPEQKSKLFKAIKKNQPIDVVALIKRGIESKFYLRGKLPKEFDERIDWQNAESVGPAVGGMIRRDGIKLFLIASLFMIMYLTFRFEFKYSIAAMVALIHDLGIISLFVALIRIEINIPVLAALLTLLGYSINDTIVIFDRIRENTAIKSKVPFIETIDRSIWQSMTRSIMTSFTTMVAVSAIIIFGGEALKGFAITLFFGLILGTYSSIFIAAPVLYSWDKYFAGRKAKVPEIEQKGNMQFKNIQ